MLCSMLIKLVSLPAMALMVDLTAALIKGVLPAAVLFSPVFTLMNLRLASESALLEASENIDCPRITE